jgi:FMN phosphatase YigB (HAD superfamily)
MKNSTEHIIFDLGGVLLNIDLERIYTGFAEILTGDEGMVTWIRTELIPAYDTGQISTHEFLEKLSIYLKPGYSEDDIVKIWNSIILDFPAERLELLRKLKKSYQVHLLSNINDLHAHCFESRFQEWFNEDPRTYFDHFFYSHHIGRRKPDVTTYTWVIEQLESTPEKMVFIDDMPENIAGASAAGLQAYQLLNKETDVIQLIQTLGLLEPGMT